VSLKSEDVLEKVGYALAVRPRASWQRHPTTQAADEYLKAEMAGYRLVPAVVTIAFTILRISRRQLTRARQSLRIIAGQIPIPTLGT
jgi:hypothetical protein